MNCTVKRLPLIFALIFVLLASQLFLAGCTQTEDSPPKTSYDQYIDSGARFGVQSGDITDQLAIEIFHAKPEDISYFTTVSDLMTALDNGKVDAVLLMEEFAKSLRGSGTYPHFGYLDIPPELYVNQAAPIFHTTELRDQYNEWLAELKADGTWAEICKFWISDTLPDAADIPRHELTGENGTLVMADTANYPPLTYVGDGGELLGLDADIMSRFAQHLGMNLEFQVMSYDAIFPAVASGKVDASAATYTLTDERQEGMIFGDATVVTSAMLITPEKASGEITDYKEFYEKNVGVITGSVYDTLAEEEFKASSVVYYNSQTEALEALKNGKVDVVFDDTSLSLLSLKEPINSTLRSLAVPQDIVSFPMAVMAHDPVMAEKQSAFLAQIKENGKLDEMLDKWIYNLDMNNIPEMSAVSLTGAEKLEVVTTGQSPPFSFVGDEQELKGLCIEMTYLFAEYLGVGEVEFTLTDRAGLLPALSSGRVDITAEPLFITEERAKVAHYADPFYADGVSAIYLPENTSAASEGFDFFTWLDEGIQRNLITEDRYKMIIDGLIVTMEISVLSQIFGTVLGCAVCYLLMRKNPIARGVASAYSGLIHGTPIVVLLMIAYYILFAKSPLDPILIAVAAFAMVEGAHIGGNLKTAISTVDKTEIEAARSMGFSSAGAFFTVTLPQALKIMLPGYMNGFVELTKATAIVGYIAIQDLSRAGDIIRSRTYDPYFPLLLVAVIYLLITTICIQIFKLIIRRVSK